MTLTITRIQAGEATNKIFFFESGEVKSLDNSTNVLSVSLDFPGDDDETDSSFSINLGTEETITLQFKLYKEDNDRSSGTDDEIITFQEIIPYLKRTMFKKTIGEVLYRIQTITKFETIDAYYELQDFSINTDSGIFPTGHLKFKFRYYA
jgi:hypothetical protein